MSGTENVPDVVWHAFRGELAQVEKLIDEDPANLEVQTSEGSTPLIAAAWGGAVDVVKKLIEKKANVDAQNTEHGWTALHAAAQNGHHDCVKVLIEAGADPCIQDKHKNTAKIYAAYHGHESISQYLKGKEEEALTKRGGADASKEGYTRVCAQCTIM